MRAAWRKIKADPRTSQDRTVELVAKRRDTQGADMHLVAYLLKPTTRYLPTDAQQRLV
jgi:hypothetical protein